MSRWIDRFELLCRRCGYRHEFTFAAHADSVAVVSRATLLHYIEATRRETPCDDSLLDVTILERDIDTLPDPV